MCSSWLLLAIVLMVVPLQSSGDSQQCLKNFPSLDQIHSPTGQLVVNPTGRSYIFPSVKFKCDTYITKIIYKGEMWRSSSFYPIIQIYEDGIPIIADYLVAQNIHQHELRSVDEGSSGTVILTPNTPIEVDDDSVLGVFLPNNSTSFVFENNPLQSLDIYYKTDQLSFYQLIQAERQTGLVPLVTVETSPSSTTSTSSSSSSTTSFTSSTSSTSSTTSSTSSTSSSTSSTSSSISSTSSTSSSSSSLSSDTSSSSVSRTVPLLHPIPVTATSSYTATSNDVYSTILPIPNPSAPTNNASTDNPTVMHKDHKYTIPYWVILLTVVGSTILVLGLSLMSVICILAIRLKKTKNELMKKQNATQQHTRQAQDSMYMETIPSSNQPAIQVTPQSMIQQYDSLAIPTRAIEHNSMIFNESYAQGHHRAHQYSHLTRPAVAAAINIPRSHTSTVSSYPAIFTMSPSLPNVVHHQTINTSKNNDQYDTDYPLYEDPDMLLAPRNYERPISTTLIHSQSLNSREQFL